MNILLIEGRIKWLRVYEKHKHGMMVQRSYTGKYGNGNMTEGRGYEKVLASMNSRF